MDKGGKGWEGVLWPQAECRLSTRCPTNLTASQPTWIASSPVKTATIHIHHHHLLLLLSLKANTHSIVPRCAEGFIDQGTRVRMCSLCQRLHTAAAVEIR